ncbi:MAG: ABC transporter substrate-binding protein [Desulfitobacteriaceae bacterium]
MYRNWRKFRAVGLILSLLLMLSGCGGGTSTASTTNTSSDTKAPIKFGFLGAKTGNIAIYGLSTLKGLQMAVEDLNKQGGLLGRQVQLIEDDNAGQKDQAINITNKLIDMEHVSAIFGDPTTGITMVAAQIANNKKTVIMSGSTGPGVVEIGPYVFRNSLLDSIAAPTLIKWAVQEKGWKNIAVITSKNNDFSVSLSKMFKDAIVKDGAKVAIEEFMQDGDTDFSAVVTKIKAANPDVIVFSGYYTEGALIMKKVRESGMSQIMISGDGLQSDDFGKIGGKAVDGTISYAGFSPEQPSAEAQKFIDAYKAKFKDNPDLFSIQAYDAVMMVAKAIKESKSADPTVYKDVLAKTKDYPGYSGTLSYKNNGDAFKSPVYLLEEQGGKFKLLKKIPVTE